MDDMDDLIPVPLAAEKAHVSRDTMFRAARSGKIKARKMGRDWFVYQTDIDRWRRDVYRPQMAKRFPAKDHADD